MNKFLGLSLVFLCANALALSTDSEQPIYIDSNLQNIDLKKDIVIFTGDVYLRQGSIRLRADKVIVTRPKSKEGFENIDAFGKPATFKQTLDDGKKIHGEATKLNYDVEKSFLTMTNNAILLQDNDNKVEGKVITYDIDKQLLVAQSDSSTRVTTILQPQTKNDKK